MNQFLKQVYQLCDGIRKQYQVRPLTAEDIYDAVQLLFFYAESDLERNAFIRTCILAINDADQASNIRCLKREEDR